MLWGNFSQKAFWMKHWRIMLMTRLFTNNLSRFGHQNKVPGLTANAEGLKLFTVRE
jgi:hypothetical protein